MSLAEKPASDALTRALSARGTTRSYSPGEALYRAGDAASSAMLIVGGFVKISARETMLGLRGPGDVLGELAALDGAPRSATVVAASHVDALVVAASEFRRVVDEDRDATRELLLSIAARLRDADLKRVEFAALGTLGRVANRLLELGERFGEPTAAGVQVSMPLSQDELASWCGSSRESTVKALRQLRELHLVETGRRMVLIRDSVGLDSHARPSH